MFAQYDPDNLLLAQARAELLVQELDYGPPGPDPCNA